MKIRNKLGVHLRSASLLVEEVSKYQAQVLIYKDGVEADGGSILSVIALFADKDSEIVVKAEGEDAEAALDGLEDLIVRRKFDEE
jgi:phosphocarrier protein